MENIPFLIHPTLKNIISTFSRLLDYKFKFWFNKITLEFEFYKMLLVRNSNIPLFENQNPKVEISHQRSTINQFWLLNRVHSMSNYIFVNSLCIFIIGIVFQDFAFSRNLQNLLYHFLTWFNRLTNSLRWKPLVAGRLCGFYLRFLGEEGYTF